MIQASAADKSIFELERFRKLCTGKNCAVEEREAYCE